MTRILVVDDQRLGSSYMRTLDLAGYNVRLRTPEQVRKEFERLQGDVDLIITNSQGIEKVVEIVKEIKPELLKASGIWTMDRSDYKKVDRLREQGVKFPLPPNMRQNDMPDRDYFPMVRRMIDDYFSI